MQNSANNQAADETLLTAAGILRQVTNEMSDGGALARQEELSKQLLVNQKEQAEAAKQTIASLLQQSEQLLRNQKEQSDKTVASLKKLCTAYEQKDTAHKEKLKRVIRACQYSASANQQQRETAEKNVATLMLGVNSSNATIAAQRQQIRLLEDGARDSASRHGELIRQKDHELEEVNRRHHETMTRRDNSVKESSRQFDEKLRELNRQHNEQSREVNHRHNEQVKESARQFDEQLKGLNRRHNDAVKAKEDELKEVARQHDSAMKAQKDELAGKKDELEESGRQHDALIKVKEDELEELGRWFDAIVKGKEDELAESRRQYDQVVKSEERRHSEVMHETKRQHEEVKKELLSPVRKPAVHLHIQPVGRKRQRTLSSSSDRPASERRADEEQPGARIGGEQALQPQTWLQPGDQQASTTTRDGARQAQASMTTQDGARQAQASTPTRDVAQQAQASATTREIAQQAQSTLETAPQPQTTREIAPQPQQTTREITPQLHTPQFGARQVQTPQADAQHVQTAPHASAQQGSALAQQGTALAQQRTALAPQAQVGVPVQNPALAAHSVPAQGPPQTTLDLLAFLNNKRENQGNGRGAGTVAQLTIPHGSCTPGSDALLEFLRRQTWIWAAVRSAAGDIILQPVSQTVLDKLKGSLGPQRCRQGALRRRVSSRFHLTASQDDRDTGGGPARPRDSATVDDAGTYSFSGGIYLTVSRVKEFITTEERLDRFEFMQL